MNVLSIAVHEKTGIIHGTTVNYEALLAIDPRTGDRVIASK